MSIGQAAAVVTLGSAVLVVLVTVVSAFVRRVRRIRWVCAVGLPFVVAYCAYRWPAWTLGSDLAQYDAWAGLGVGLPFLPALVVSITIVAVADRRVRRARPEPPA
jgi:hypothetical protein